MNVKVRGLVAAGVLAACGAVITAPAAQAAAPGGSSSATDMDKLKDQGYTCGRMGVGGYLCTKKGSPDQVCDNAGTCTAVKVVPVRPPVVKPPVAPPPVGQVPVGHVPVAQTPPPPRTTAVSPRALEPAGTTTRSTS